MAYETGKHRSEDNNTGSKVLPTYMI